MWPRLSAVRSRAEITPRVMSTTAVASRTSPMSRKMTTSDLDFDDFLDDERPGDGPGSGQDEDDPPEQRGRERVEVRWILEIDHDDHEDRQRGHDPPRHAALHSQRLDHPPQVEALANGRGD